MRKIKEVLRLTWDRRQSQRQVARYCGISRSCVREYLHRVESAGLAWPLPDDLDDTQHEKLLFPALPPEKLRNRPIPDWLHIHSELKRKGVTKFLLWQEYRTSVPKGENLATRVELD